MESAGHHPKAARCPGARPAALLLSLTASLIWEGLKVNGQEMARTDMRSTSVAVSDSPLRRNSSPGIKGSCKEGYFFFQSVWEVCWRESSGTDRAASNTPCKPRCLLLYFFLAVLTSHYKQVFSLSGSH